MILLDTHIVIWLAFSPEKISKRAAEAIHHARGQQRALLISGVTLYEIALLAAKGRINLKTVPEQFLTEIENQFIVQPLTGRISIETTRLPAGYPKDPMDRIIGATAIAEGLHLVTADTAIQRSKAVATIW